MINLQSNWQASVRFTCADTGTPAKSSQTLANEISQAFSQTLEQLGIDPSSIKLTLDTGSGQMTGTNQNAANQNATRVGFSALIPRDTPSTTSNVCTTAAVVTTPTHWYANNAADDAYWNAQPAPVQQLREIRDQEQRQVLAEDLASRGYTIDNAIMVWGWDAGQVMAERQADGYTWVPSATQPNVSAAPGITGPGITPYDPSHPPAGSIVVPSGSTVA